MDYEEDYIDTDSYYSQSGYEEEMAFWRRLSYEKDLKPCDDGDYSQRGQGFYYFGKCE